MAWLLTVICPACGEENINACGYYKTKKAAKEAASTLDDNYDVEIERVPLPEYAEYEENY